MSKVIFIWWLLNGTVTPAGEHEGHKMYTVWFNETNQVIDYAYKAEVINYIKTGVFEYDDFLEMPDKTPIDEEIFYSNN